MSRSRIFPVRFSDAEIRRLETEAKAKNWSVGRLIRSRSLGQDLHLDKRLRALEAQLNTTIEGEDG